MTDFYVYIHRRLSDNQPYYVGKGKGKRAWKFSGRSEFWTRTHKKHGTIVDVLFTGLTEDDAFRIEKDVITELRYFQYPLCNLTDGGEGASGFVPSQEMRDKISKVHKGRVKSEQERQNLSKALTGQKLSAERIERMRKQLTGKKQTEQTKKKRSETLLNVGTCNDRNTYVFFNDEDFFIGTRKDFCEYANLHRRKIRTLFSKQQSKVVFGWSVLKFNQLLILKEIIK